MPANYAHYRFGRECMDLFPPETRRTVQRFRQLYDVGLHGPDLFYYYNPYTPTKAGNLGRFFHKQTGREFFTQACEMLKKSPSEGGMAYLWGVLGHYCLDSVCHPFVHEAIADGKITHVELEAEFDRFLLDRDGRTPACTQDISGHMKLTRGECVTVSAFYPPATPANIHSSVLHMARCTKLLAWKKRKLLKNLLRLTPAAVQQSMMQDPANHRCLHLNEELLPRYNQALEKYPILLAQLMDYMKNGTPLGEEFEATFG